MSYRNRAFLIFPVLAATTFFLTTACKKSSYPTTPPDAALSATIADTSWTVYYNTAIYYQSRGFFEVNGVSAGTKADSSYLQLVFSAPIQLNKTISTDSTFSVEYYDLLGNFDWGAGTNSGDGVSYLKVTSYDSVNHKIAGTFTGSLSSGMSGASYTDTVKLTNGEFNLTYTTQP
jgi:hypothetical protein